MSPGPVRSRSRSAAVWVGSLALVLVAAIGVDLLRAAARPPLVTKPDPEQRARARGWRPAVQLGEIAPDFRFTDRSGASHRLSDYRGKPILLAFYDSGRRSQVFCREFQKIRKHVGARRIEELAVF